MVVFRKHLFFVEIVETHGASALKKPLTLHTIFANDMPDVQKYKNSHVFTFIFNKNEQAISMILTLQPNGDAAYIDLTITSHLKLNLQNAERFSYEGHFTYK